MIDPTTIPARTMRENGAADDEALNPTWWRRDISAEQADAILAATERWFIVAMMVLSAIMLIGIGGGLIVAGIACLGLAGVVARS